MFDKNITYKKKKISIYKNEVNIQFKEHSNTSLFTNLAPVSPQPQ